jgi:hypothetical protein
MTSVSDPAFSLTALRQTIQRFIGAGVIDQRVLGALIVGGQCVPVEGSLWDYKKLLSRPVNSA